MKVSEHLNTKQKHMSSFFGMHGAFTLVYLLFVVLLSLHGAPVFAARFLGVCPGFAGHIRPLVELLRELNARGHDVMLISDEMAPHYADLDFIKHDGKSNLLLVDHSSMYSAGNANTSLKLWYERTFEVLYDEYWAQTGKGGAISEIVLTANMLDNMIGVMVDMDSRTARVVRDTIDSFRPDAVIMDSGSFMSSAVVTAYKVPCILNHPTVHVPGINFNTPSIWSGLTEKEIQTYPMRILHPLESVISMVKIIPRIISAINEFNDPNVTVEHSNAMDRCLNLVNAPLGFIPATEKSLPNIVNVGPMVSSRMNSDKQSNALDMVQEALVQANKPGLWNWINANRDKKLVLAMLGSATSYPPHITKTLLDGVAQLVEQHSDVSVLMSLRLRNWKSYQEWLGEKEQNQRIIVSGRMIVDDGFLPQRHLLMLKDQFRVFISHGGLNSVMESLTVGTPVLVAHGIGDQPGVAARVHDAKAGMALYLRNQQNFTAQDVVVKVRAILDDVKYRNNAERIAKIIKFSGGAIRGAEWAEHIAEIGTVDHLLLPWAIPGRFGRWQASGYDIILIFAISIFLSILSFSFLLCRCCRSYPGRKKIKTE